MSARPSPGELDGGRFWATATIALADRSVTLPVSAGRVVWQADQWPGTQVSGLVVPRFDDQDVDVYAAGLVGDMGHRVRLTAHAVDASGREWSWSLGEYRVDAVSPGAVSVEINASDLVRAIITHEAAVPTAVHQTARPVEVMATMFAEDHVSFWHDPALVHPRVRSGFTIGTDRGETLQALTEMWGVYLVPHETGGIAAYPLPSGPVERPVARFSETDTYGDTGPIIDSVLELSREDVHNHIIVPVRDSEKVAEAVQTTGPYAVDRFGWNSLRLDNAAVGYFPVAQGVAQTTLHHSLLRTATRPVETTPDWRLGPYTQVEIETVQDGIQWGRITGFEVPLVHDETAVYHVGLEV